MLKRSQRQCKWCPNRIWLKMSKNLVPVAKKVDNPIYWIKLYPEDSAIPRGPLPYLVLCGYVPLNRVWFSRSWVLNRVRNFTIKHLEQGLFGLEAFQSVKTCDERSTFAIPIIFFVNIYCHDFSVKNYLILYENKTNQAQKIVSPVLNRVGVWRPRRTALTRLPLNAPQPHHPPPPPFRSAIGFPNTYALDSDLSDGQRYPTFEQPGPDSTTDLRSE